MGQVADLVEEQGAAVGVLDLADGLLAGAGEGALLVAEELALEQRVGNGRAVDRHHALAGAGAQLVHGAGEALLAGARGAEEQGRDVRRGDLLHRAADLQHLRADGDDVVQGHVLRMARCRAWFSRSSS
jgi:hypothetical protein